MSDSTKSVGGSFDPNRAPHTMQQQPAADAVRVNQTTVTRVMDLAAGGRIGKYEILRELGQGGMGRVYLARDPNLNREVAVKVLLSRDPFEMSRFRDEGPIIAHLRHPNIVEVFDLPEIDMPCLVLEYIDGGSLADRMQRNPPSPRKAAEWMIDITKAIQFAHENGIIHRDLKPGNVLVTRSGTLKVCDFGLGKRLESGSDLTRSGSAFGTPSYMAPEQLRDSKNVTPAADVYSLGAMLYEMLVGRPPFRVTSPKDFDRVFSDDPLPPSAFVSRLPRDLCTIALKCLEKNPLKRYPTAAELRDDLQRYLDGQPIHARPIGWWEKTWRRVARRPVEAAFTLLSLLLVAAIVGGVWMYREQGYTAQRELIEKTHRNELEQRQELALKVIDEIRLQILNTDLSMPSNLNQLNGKLADFYQKSITLDLKGGSEEGEYLAKLAHGYQNLGELTGKTGKKSLAAQQYADAADLFSRAYQKNPQRDWRINQAKALTGEGRYRREIGEYTVAKTVLQRANELLSTELTASTSASEWNTAAEVMHYQGELEYRTRTFREALAAFSHAIRYREQAYKYWLSAPTTPDDGHVIQRGLARDFGWRGDVYRDLGDWRHADRDYWESHQLRDQLAKEDSSDENRFQFSRSWGNLYSLQIRNRTAGSGSYFMEQSIEIQRKLVAARASVTEYRDDLASNLTQLAELRLMLPPHEQPIPDKVRNAVETILKEAEAHLKVLAELNENDPALRTTIARAAAVRLRLETNPAQVPNHIVTIRAKLVEDSKRTPTDWYISAVAAAYEKDIVSALEALRKAAEKQYRDLHPDDIARDRAFFAIRDERRFQQILDTLRETTRPPQ